MQLDELHDRLFEVLCVVDQICRDNHVRYCLDGGTELGAIREHDFIPWDDDMDICVLSEDYETFVRVMREKLPEHLHIVEPGEISPYFFDNISRIYDDRWIYREETEEDRVYNKYLNHVGTDVFIYVGCPDSKFGQKLFNLKNKILHGMLMAYRYRIDWNEYTLLQKIQVYVLRIMGRIYSGKTPDRLLKTRNRWMRRYDPNRTGFRISVNAPILEHYMHPMKNEWFAPVISAQIRGKAFPVESGFDNKLKTIYGDYMTPVQDHKKYIKHL